MSPAKQPAVTEPPLEEVVSTVQPVGKLERESSFECNWSLVSALPGAARPRHMPAVNPRLAKTNHHRLTSDTVAL